MIPPKQQAPALSEDDLDRFGITGARLVGGSTPREGQTAGAHPSTPDGAAMKSDEFRPEHQT
jgi:hypothetical protein